jgi:hypothetical protein
MGNDSQCQFCGKALSYVEKSGDDCCMSAECRAKLRGEPAAKPPSPPSQVAVAQQAAAGPGISLQELEGAMFRAVWRGVFVGMFAYGFVACALMVMLVVFLRA